MLTGSDWEKEGDILHTKVFIHRVIWNEELGIIPVTNKKWLISSDASDVSIQLDIMEPLKCMLLG